MSLKFTLAFEGDIRKANANPLTTETPFGVAYAAGIGDQFEVADIFREALEKIAGGGAGVTALTAQDALDAADEILMSQIKEAKGK